MEKLFPSHVSSKRRRLQYNVPDNVSTTTIAPESTTTAPEAHTKKCISRNKFPQILLDFDATVPNTDGIKYQLQLLQERYDQQEMENTSV